MGTGSKYWRVPWWRYQTNPYGWQHLPCVYPPDRKEGLRGLAQFAPATDTRWRKVLKDLKNRAFASLTHLLLKS